MHDDIGNRSIVQTASCEPASYHTCMTLQSLMITVCMLYLQQICFVEEFLNFSEFVAGSMKISGFLSAGFLKIMVKNLFLFRPRPGHK